MDGRGGHPQRPWLLVEEFQVRRRLLAITTGFDFVLDLVVLIKAIQSGLLHRRDMDKRVLAAPFRGNKAEAFGGVEKLNDAFGGHDKILGRSSTVPAATGPIELRLGVR